MSRKYKKSVWGIYPTRLALETAIDRLRESGFLSSDISFCCPKTLGPRIWLRKNSLKRQKELRLGRVQGYSLAERWGDLRGSGLLLCLA